MDDVKRYRIFLSLVIIAGVILFLWLPRSARAQTPPNGQIVIVSDEGQVNIPGQWVREDVTLLRADATDPHSDWRNRDFNDAGWTTVFPVQRVATWATTTLPDADHIWGENPSGALVPDAGPALPYPRRNNGAFGFPIVTSPSPQYLFLRKNFCIPINAQLNSNDDPAPTFVNDLQLLPAVDGDVRMWLNGLYPLWDISGDESGSVATVPMPPNVRDGTVLYRGNNTLSMRALDNDPTDQAALLYSWRMGYTIDPGAIQINYTGQRYVGHSINFNYNAPDGLSRRPPYNAVWDFGDGSGDTDSPHTYTAPGTYNVTLWLEDADGCPGVSGTTIVIEWEPSQLEITKSADRAVVMPGEVMQFDLTARVTGPALPLNNVTVVDTLPPGTSFVSCSDGCALNGNEVQWNLGLLNPGYVHTFQLQVQLNANFTGDRVVNNYRATSDETGMIVGTAVAVGVSQPLPTNTPSPTNTPALQAASEPSEVPEASTLIMLGGGIATLAGYASFFRLKRRRGK